MEKVNALQIRNNLGQILDHLNKKGEPILISKARKVRAVLITLEQFEKRFLDWQSEGKKKHLLSAVKQLRKKRIGNLTSLSVLRELRGYKN